MDDELNKNTVSHSERNRSKIYVQQGGLQAVTNLSTIASGLIAEIKEQTK